jgi:hypothetical protein
VVLIDEWIAYARQLWNRDDLAAGSLDTHMTFARSLTKAAKSVRNCLLVVSIPSSDSVRDTGGEHSHEIGGVGGVEALKRLRAVVHRTDSPWQPASADESFEIVGRQLSKAIAPDDLVHRDVTCRRASILAELGVPPRRAMYLLGHWDPKFTMRVYQQVLNMGGGAQDQLESALGCTCEGAFVVLTGRWFED